MKNTDLYKQNTPLHLLYLLFHLLIHDSLV